ncbi:unnamed protein product [Rotaria magnacalcarata]|uniref:Uncharacterized protein n=1 Tax=Rotaria magnacalcarata TaxID=392030 RepID=A0A8S2KQX5_9BILA|nr:unnamed protein product [Rotaria magnacalcarata]
MASRTRLFTRFRDLPLENIPKAIEIINVVIFDINMDINDRILNNPRFQAKVFTGEHIDLCINYIKSSIANTYLFISNTISNEMIQVIGAIPQTKFIYTFCNNDQYENFPFTNSKVQGAFNDVNVMFNKFQQDIRELDYNSYSQESSSQTLDGKSAEILWWRIFDKILLHIRHTAIARDELVEFCRSWFCKDHTELRLIDEFNLGYESFKSVELHDKNIWRVYLKSEDNIWDTDFDERSIFCPHADEIFIRHLSRENKQFIIFQVLLNMMLRLDQNKYAKDELLEFCPSKYEHESIEMGKINDFEQNYESKDAAKWYTKYSFLYRLLNKSLRIETIDYIVKMRYYIHDLHNQLAELQSSFINTLNPETVLMLYRGQVMKKNQLNEIQDNIGGFMSMNSFISATQDPAVARVFSGMGENLQPDEVSVIYEMTIDTNIRSTPYAKIDTINPDEQEILFSIGAIFKIEKIDQLSANIYSVKLTMTHIDDELWNKLTAHLN